MEIMYQPAPGKPYKEPNVTINRQKLAAVNKFTYLGSTLSHCIHMDDETDSGAAKASVAFGRLRQSVWECWGLSLTTKLSVYKAIILSTLLFASKTWTIYQRHAKKISCFHLNCLCKLLKVKWQDKVPDTAILEQTGMSSIFALLRMSQLRWAGHVSRMPDEWLPKRLRYGELQTGVCNHGGQKKCFKDTLKASLKDFPIDHDSWEMQAQDWTAWHSAIHKGAAIYEQQRIETATNPPAHTSAPAPLSCPHCDRTFQAWIGLISHLQTYPSS